MTRPGAAGSWRRHHLLAVTVPIALSTLTCCGAGERFELTLRARDAKGPTEQPACVEGNHLPDVDESSPSDVFTCVLTLGPTEWRAADGRRAASEAQVVLRFLALPPHFGDVACGGQTVRHQFWYRSETELPGDDKSFQLTIDGAETLQLEMSNGVWAANSDTELLCFEGTGRWRGEAGRLKDRAGGFTIVYDTVQTRLRLIED